MIFKCLCFCLVSSVFKMAPKMVLQGHLVSGAQGSWDVIYREDTC